MNNRVASGLGKSGKSEVLSCIIRELSEKLENVSVKNKVSEK